MFPYCSKCYIMKLLDNAIHKQGGRYFMKKKIALLMACTMVAASLAGCGGWEHSRKRQPQQLSGDNCNGSRGDNRPAAPACGDVAMTMFWWGNQVRNENTGCPGSVFLKPMG